ncbi:hypothetical protein ACFL5V_04300 [Fibrobacterota bacterium]
MKKLGYILTAGLILQFTGCSAKKTMGPVEDIKGSAEININVGPVGALAKATEISMETLYLTLTANEEETITRTYSLSGNDGNVISELFGDLASFKNWTLSAASEDVNGVIIHEGTTSFYVYPEITAEVLLNLDSKYAMLIAGFTEVADSVTVLDMVIDGVEKDDCEVTEQGNKKTAELSYDYLETGLDHVIAFNGYGTMWGKDYLLYTGSVEVNLAPGEDKSYAVTLEWVGPDAPPAGQATMEVNLGAVGTARVNGKFEKHQTGYQTD